MTAVGFIGLGNMGKPMASNLCRKGFSPVVYDIRPEPMHALERLGARAATSAADVAAGCDVVFTMLPSSASVEEVIAGPEGVLAHARPGLVIVDMRRRLMSSMARRRQTGS